LQSIHYTDKAIGEFIEGLKKDGLYDKSLIVIWGDHGSYTNISTALGANILPKLSNSQVPLIILNSGLENKIIYEPASQLDIYPTITNLLGIVPPKSILGQDLFNTNTPVETHFETISGGIDAILTKDLIYEASEDGLFSHGFCKSYPDMNSVPISDCQNIYTQEADTLKASNIIIRGNLLNFYTSNLKK
jgi:lipoteichoic acid synthase